MPPQFFFVQSNAAYAQLCDFAAGSPNVFIGLSPSARSVQLLRVAGGRGRIRTSVARKERQIYSLLVLATHPPVPRKHPGREFNVPQSIGTLDHVPQKIFGTQLHRPAQTTRTRPDICTGNIAMQRGLVSKDTSPSAFVARNPSATLPKIPVPQNSAGGGS